MGTRTRKILTYGLGGLIVLAAAGAVYFYFFKLGFLEIEKNRSLSSPLVSGNVEIYRDNHGVPHIYGQSTSDVMFAAGYTMAEDRLFQIEMITRVGTARMSEILGPDFLDLDKNTLLHGYSDAERVAMIAAMPPEANAGFIAMVAGINAYVEEAQKNPAEKLPLEFSGLNISLKKYTPEDILAGINVILRFFGSSGGTELTNKAFLEDMIERHGPEAAKIIFDDVLPLTDPDAYTTSLDSFQATVLAPSTRDYASFSKAGNKLALAYREKQLAARDTLASLGITEGASRTILVGPERSATGNPLMMQATADGGDMHLIGPDFNFSGLVISPIGLPVMGRTPNAGVLITTGEMDTKDVFAVKTDPEDPNKYFYKGAWHAMEQRTVSIQVKGQTAVNHDVFRTVHGPVIMRDEEENTAYSLKWALWEQEADIWASALLSLKVSSSEEYAQHLETTRSSNSNISYADTTGSFGFRHMGDLPLRAESVDPRLPSNGDGSEDWQGFVPADEMPKLRDPEKGYLMVWNNSPAPGTVYGDASRWGKHFRTHLPVALIEEREKISLEDLKVFNALIGASFYSVDLSLTSPRFFDDFMKEAATNTDDSRVKEAANFIMEWDGLFTDGDKDGYYDHVGATLFRTWLPTALETIFADDIGDWWLDIDDEAYIPYRTSLLIRVLEGDVAGQPIRWDYFNGKDRADVVIESLRRTVDKVAQDFKASDMASWKQPVFYRYLTRADAGDTEHPRIRPGRATSYQGAATRFGYLPKAVVDNGMPDWTAIMEITDEDPYYLSATPSGGQSWFINQDWKASPHINDQYDKHAGFTYKKVSLNDEKIKSSYESLLVIEPK